MTATVTVCTVSWCMGQDEPRVCGGRDHLAEVDTVTCTGDLERLDDLRVAAATNGDQREDVVTIVSRGDRWMTELRPVEARRLAESLLRHVALVEGESGTR